MTSLELTTRDELQADSQDLSKQSWLDTLADTASAAIDSAGRTVSEYASTASTQATSYYNDAQATLEAVSDSVEKKGAATTFWNYAAPIRRMAVRELIKPMIGDRAANVLEKSADTFMNAPAGEGIQSVGEFVGQEFAPELNQAAKAWDDFSSTITPEDNSLGAYYKAFVRGADYVYDLGLSEDPFGVTLPKLPTISFGDGAPLSLELSDQDVPTDFEPLPVVLPVEVASQSETEPEYFYQTTTANEETWEDSSWATTDENFSDDVSFVTTEESSDTASSTSSSEEVLLVGADEAYEIIETAFDEVPSTEDAVPTSAKQKNLKTENLAANETSAQTETLITPTLEAVATLTPGDTAESTVAAQQELLATVFEFGAAKDLCTSDDAQTPKQDRETVVMAATVISTDEFPSPPGNSQAVRQDAKIFKDGSSTGVTTTDTNSVPSEQSAIAANAATTDKDEKPARYSHEFTILSEAKILSSIAFVAPDPFFVAKNTATFFVGPFLLMQSKNESATAKSREQEIFDGETARTLHAVTRQDSSNSGSDSSHHQDNGTADAIAGVADVTADDKDEINLDDAVAAPIYTDTVVIL